MSYPNGAKFTPPMASTLPAFLPDTKGPAFGLAKYRNVLQQGVVVYALSDGTFRQDVPTAENSNTAVPPYPLMPDQELPNIINVDYTGAYPANPPTRVVTTISPYVTAVYYGGHTYTVSQATATALAGYTAHGTGYAADLVAL